MLVFCVQLLCKLKQIPKIIYLNKPNNGIRLEYLCLQIVGHMQEKRVEEDKDNKKKAEKKKG